MAGSYSKLLLLSQEEREEAVAAAQKAVVVHTQTIETRGAQTDATGVDFMTSLKTHGPCMFHRERIPFLQDLDMGLRGTRPLYVISNDEYKKLFTKSKSQCFWVIRKGENVVDANRHHCDNKKLSFVAAMDRSSLERTITTTVWISLFWHQFRNDQIVFRYKVSKREKKRDKARETQENTEEGDVKDVSDSE